MTLEEKVFYDTNGNPLIEQISGNFENGVLNGEGQIIIYDMDGKEVLERRGNFENGVLNGEGEIIDYYGNGNIKSEMKGTFKEGILNDGKFIDYDWNGRITLEMDGKVFYKYACEYLEFEKIYLEKNDGNKKHEY